MATNMPLSVELARIHLTLFGSREMMIVQLAKMLPKPLKKVKSIAANSNPLEDFMRASGTFFKKCTITDQKI